MPFSIWNYSIKFTWKLCSNWSNDRNQREQIECVIRTVNEYSSFGCCNQCPCISLSLSFSSRTFFFSFILLEVNDISFKPYAYSHTWTVDSFCTPQRIAFNWSKFNTHQTVTIVKELHTWRNYKKTEREEKQCDGRRLCGFWVIASPNKSQFNVSHDVSRQKCHKCFQLLNWLFRQRKKHAHFEFKKKME